MKHGAGGLQVTPFSDLGAVASQAECERVWPEGLALALLDTSSHTGVLGGAARNVLALLATHFPAATVTLLALCAAHGTLSAEHSQAMTLQLPGGMVPASAPLLGWESSRPHPVRTCRPPPAAAALPFGRCSSGGAGGGGGGRTFWEGGYSVRVLPSLDAALLLDLAGPAVSAAGGTSIIQ